MKALTAVAVKVEKSSTKRSVKTEKAVPPEAVTLRNAKTVTKMALVTGHTSKRYHILAIF